MYNVGNKIWIFQAPNQYYFFNSCYSNAVCMELLILSEWKGVKQKTNIDRQADFV